MSPTDPIAAAAAAVRAAATAAPTNGGAHAATANGAGGPAPAGGVLPDESRSGRDWRAALEGLALDARHAARWTMRGRIATSPLVPEPLRRYLVRLGGVDLQGMVYGLERCWFQSAHISIGSGTYLNAGCWFEGNGRIEVGNDCLFGPEVMVLTSTHAQLPGGAIARVSESRAVRIGARSWLGARAVVLPGVEIGAGAVIAAGAVVSRDCEAGGYYGGVPARRIR
ncbi:MAG TPA: DapH/DapD/GlmU-related protein [Solirubrobacteraceae bacterium]|nr:DapH/DapD/GlmU-related protein [Solirubrobacteraceae bacterium]